METPVEEDDYPKYTKMSTELQPNQQISGILKNPINRTIMDHYEHIS